MFSAYRGDHSKVNSSEGGNRTWTQMVKTLKLVDAVKADACEYIFVDAGLILFLNNQGPSSGKNPNQEK